MTPDDPFFDDIDPDRTIIRPTPGRQGVPQGQPRDIPTSPGAVPPPPPQQQAAPAPAGMGTFEAMLGRGLNPLLDSASALILLACQLRNTASHGDVAGLRSYVEQAIKKFEANTLKQGFSQEGTLTARYIICVFVDETVMGTPWGSESNWSGESLLNTFHQEAWGGEKFFVLLDRLSQQPANNIDLLELIYVALALGFRGKYGVAQMGLSQLSEVQGNLYRTITNQRGDFERELSPHWQGVPDKRNVLERYVPLWVVAALAGVLLLVLFAGFRLILDNTANPVIDTLEEVSYVQESPGIADERNADQGTPSL